MAKKEEKEAKKGGGELLFCGTTTWDTIGRRKGLLDNNLVSPTRLWPLVGVDIRFVASGYGKVYLQSLLESPMDRLGDVSKSYESFDVRPENTGATVRNSSAPPCPTIFVANLGPACTEQELITQVFSRCRGFLKLKIHSTYGTHIKDTYKEENVEVKVDRKPKSQHNIEPTSRVVVDRLLNRNGKDIILLPYNPGNHWVLAVLDMKGATCYYLDSLCPGSVFEPLRQIIDTATTVYSAQTSTGKRFKLRWVNTKCPCQPGITECGYYVMKFMKEIVTDGLGILDNVGGGVEAYSDADIDYVREEWSGYASTFIFKL